jgi:hypothetical protein
MRTTALQEHLLRAVERESCRTEEDGPADDLYAGALSSVCGVVGKQGTWPFGPCISVGVRIVRADGKKVGRAGECSAQ